MTGLQQACFSSPGRMCFDQGDNGLCSLERRLLHQHHRAIKENYGLDIAPTVQAWSDIVVSLGYGGELLKDTMKSVAGCDGPDYDGDTIQFMRTNLCLYDIFTASSACNVEVPKHKICKETCDSYKAAVDDLLSDPKSCPVKKDLPDWGDIEKEREYVSSQSTICASQIAKWEAKTPNYDDVCFVGVKDDMKSCGLGGNIEEAETYCKNSQKPSAVMRIRRQRQMDTRESTPSIPRALRQSPPLLLPPRLVQQAWQRRLIFTRMSPHRRYLCLCTLGQGLLHQQYRPWSPIRADPLTDPSDWDQAVTLLTSGGDLLKQVLGDYTGCTGYAGDPSNSSRPMFV
ncbi:hypothetical protein BC829DRAFT_194770 [Chytridium lagenaria]|nr:hypothetical protein BC829DRAFT_194770 [Chytridium lagenaria]